MKTRYGWVEIENSRYDHDVIVHCDQSVTKRSKKKSKKFRSIYGHTPLSEMELSFLDREKPEIVFIGTGQFGELPITAEALRILGAYETAIRPTPEILDLMASESRPAIAILHVNC